MGKLSKIAILALGAEVVSLRSQNLSLENDISALEGDISNHESDIANLQSDVADLTAELGEVADTGVLVLSDDSIQLEGILESVGLGRAYQEIAGGIRIQDIVNEIPDECTSKITIINTLITECNGILSDLAFDGETELALVQAKKTEVDVARAALADTMTDNALTPEVLVKRSAYTTLLVAYKNMAGDYFTRYSVDEIVNDTKASLQSLLV